MGFPKTLIEFQERFPNEESCWALLRHERWPRGFVCPRCGSRGSHFIRTRSLEQCRRCRYQASVTAGTVFHRTRVPLRVWLLGVFFLGRHKKGISALQFQKDAGLGSYQTAWTLLHKLRSGLGPRPADRLTGDVEADETYIGGYRLSTDTISSAIRRRLLFRTSRVDGSSPSSSGDRTEGPKGLAFPELAPPPEPSPAGEPAWTASEVDQGATISNGPGLRIPPPEGLHPHVSISRPQLVARLRLAARSSSRSR